MAPRQARRGRRPRRRQAGGRRAHRHCAQGHSVPQVGAACYQHRRRPRGRSEGGGGHGVQGRGVILMS